MAKANGAEEVEIVRFFENGPIEKVEVVFNIVAAKMRERLRGVGDDSRRGSSKRRKPAEGDRPSGVESAEPIGRGGNNPV